MVLTFEVVRPSGEREEVNADRVEIADGGVLAFYRMKATISNQGRLAAAYKSWESVERV